MFKCHNTMIYNVFSLDTGTFVQEVMIVYSSMQTALTYQLCLVVVKEFGDNFKLLFNTGGGESINYNKVKFQFNSPKQYCLERYAMSYQMCSILPEGTLIIYLSIWYCS